MSRRIPFLIGFLICVALIAGAVYMQHGLGMEPCNLCIFQREVIIGIGLVLLIGAIHGPRTWGRRIYGAITGLLSLVGIGLSARHLWIQAQPEGDTPVDCAAGLDFMFQAMPAHEVVQMVLLGTGDCAEVHKVFGLSIPLWTLFIFIAFLIASLYFLFKKSETRHFERISGLNKTR